jgi:hypothetical protein
MDTLKPLKLLSFSVQSSETNFVEATIPSNEGLVTSPVKICLTINHSKLWEIGDFGDESANYLITNSINKIDGHSVIIDRNSIIKFGPPVLLYNKNKKLVGSHTNAFSYCSLDTKLDSGTHYASVEMRNKSGILFSYTWHFQVS